MEISRELEIVVSNQLDAEGVDEVFRFGRCKQLEFVDAGGAQAGADSIEVDVVIAGVTYEFPGALGHVLQQCAKECAVQVAGGNHTEGAVGGLETGFFDEAEPLGPQDSQCAHFQSPLQERAISSEVCKG